MRALVLFVSLIAAVAFADRVLGTATSASAQITNGTWSRLPDAGFIFTVCGTARLTDGGVATLPDSECETCEPGAWNSAPATCVAQWKANRGL